MFRPEMRRESDHHRARGWRCLMEGGRLNSVFQGRLEESDPGWGNSVNVKGVVRDWCVESFCWIGRFVWKILKVCPARHLVLVEVPTCTHSTWKGWLGLQQMLFYLLWFCIRFHLKSRVRLWLLRSLKFTSAEDFYLNMGIEHVYFRSFLKTH